MGNWFQKLLWNIAGAEIPILEKCQTDHKKYSAIGATILMTAFIALCAGTSAAWFFTQKGDEDAGALGWSFAFGLVWATLIFCIDRSLVITLKKKENRTTLGKLTWWMIPLLSRAALAVVVAFMVSIPLELVIFEDYIRGNEENFLANKTADLGKRLKKNSGEDVLTSRIASADSLLVRLGKESTKLEKEIAVLQGKINTLESQKNNPNSTEYNNARNRLKTAQSLYNSAASNYNAENQKQYPSPSNLSKYQGQKNTYSSQMSAARRDMSAAAAAWKKKKQDEIDKLLPQRDEKIPAKAKKDDDHSKTLESRNNDKEREQKAAAARGEREEKKQGQLSAGNHFILNYQILEDAVHQRDENGNLVEADALFFLWLVRILFIIIELLPTVVKIVSPFGSYERMVAAEERNLIEYLESEEYTYQIKNIHRLALSSQEELEQEQHDTEVELKKSILDKIKTAQLEVAELAIEKWKEQEVAKLMEPPVVHHTSKEAGTSDDDETETTFI